MVYGKMNECRYFGSVKGGVGAFDEDFGAFHSESVYLLLLFVLKLILFELRLTFLSIK
jgi:hypothetical protein